MSKGNAGNMLGVGGTRSKLSRKRTARRERGPRRPAGGPMPEAQKRELLRKFQERANGGVAGGPPERCTVRGTRAPRGGRFGSAYAEPVPAPSATP